jgi:hypothetical protein
MRDVLLDFSGLRLWLSLSDFGRVGLVGRPLADQDFGEYLLRFDSSIQNLWNVIRTLRNFWF